jgi:hypothetical protein
VINQSFTESQQFLLRCIRTRAGQYGYGLLDSELVNAIPLVDAGFIEVTPGRPHSRGTYFRITPLGRAYLVELDDQPEPLSEADEFWGAAEMACNVCGID